MKKTRFIGFFLAIILIFTSLVPVTAFAAQDAETADGEVIEENITAAAPYMLKTELVNEKTNEVKLWLELSPTNAESITAFSISLRVVNKNGEIVAGRKADFTFASALKSAEVKKSKFNPDTQVLNLYVASTKNLVKTESAEMTVDGKKVVELTNTLDLGTVKVEKLSDSANKAFKVVLNGRVGELMVVGLDAEVKDVRESVATDYVIPVDGVVYNADIDYIISTAIDGKGKINLFAVADNEETAIPGNTVDENTNVRVEAIADEGYELKSINVVDQDGKTVDITEGKQFIADGDKTVKVVFEKIKSNNNCSCIHHKSGIWNILYRILRLFWKLFNVKQICACGEAHY